MSPYSCQIVGDTQKDVFEATRALLKRLTLRFRFIGETTIKSEPNIAMVMTLKEPEDRYGYVKIRKDL